MLKHASKVSKIFKMSKMEATLSKARLNKISGLMVKASIFLFADEIQGQWLRDAHFAV